MQLLDARGDSVAQRPLSEHDPEQVARERQRLMNELARCRSGYEQDMTPDPLGATVPHKEAIRAHWNAQWDQFVGPFMKHSRLPITVEPEALRNWFAELDRKAEERAAALAREERFRTPLHEFNDLGEFELELIGDTSYGKLWMNNIMSITVAENGEVRLWFEGRTKGWIDTFEPSFGPFVNYTARELFSLLHALRVPGITKPLPFQVEAAKQ